MTVDVAEVWLWNDRVGAVALDDLGVSVFEYDTDFLKLGLDVAPLMMPLEEARRGHAIHAFPALNPETFKRLPGLLADTLPDKFGQVIVNAWLARQGRSPDDFSILERLCYTGSRAMGALEFKPAITEHLGQPVSVEIGEMVTLIQNVMNHRNSLDVTLSQDEQKNQEALLDILRIGTSAGGARAKAVIAYNEKTGEVLSGQADAPEGFEHWLLKFDGVSDIEFGKTSDFNMAGAYGYEQALMTMRKMKLSKKEQLQQYRRMVFNVIARNQDDHTKNIAFLMTPQGKWSLSPAFDMTHSYKPGEGWTQTHQMSINGKRDHFTRQDLIDVAQNNDLKNPEAVIQDVVEAVEQWPAFSADAGVSRKKTETITKDHRLALSH